MKPTAEYEKIAEDVFHWHDYNPECRTECSSTAVQTPEGIVLIDPLRLEEQAIERMVGEGRVVAVLLTNGNHERGMAYEKERLDVPIYAPEEARNDVVADHGVRDGDLLFQSLRAIALPGGGRGETAYLAPGTLILGDALIHLEGLSILPDKYCADPHQLRQSLKALIPLAYEVACFAHGRPILSGARSLINQVVAAQ
jgi:hypothetical protein